MRLIDEERKKS